MLGISNFFEEHNSKYVHSKIFKLLPHADFESPLSEM